MLRILIGNLFIVYCLVFGIISNAYALDLEKLKISFLQGDYKSAIIEGEKILAGAQHSSGLDELYYILALSYLKDGNYLRASDIFEIILREFKNSKFKEEASLSLADTYFLRGDFIKAQDYYRQLLDNNPRTKLKAQILYRLAQCGFKQGDTGKAKEYSVKLKTECPFILESGLGSDVINSADVYYAVQVGAFANTRNADNLVQRLNQKGYSAYIEEANSEGRVSYRVRVGKCSKRKEAEDLENRLSKEGYSTRIYP